MKKNMIPSVFTAIAFVFMAALNFLAVILPINNVTPGEVSDSYPNLFAPAGFTFSIWSVIYILLFGFALYQLGVFKKDDSRADMLQKVRVYFILSSVCNGAWIFAWHYKVIPLSMLLIVGILSCLVLIVKAIGKENFSLKEYVFIRLPFSIYFGWITVATIANVTILLVSLGWDGFGVREDIWTVIVIIIGMLIGGVTMLKNKDVAYGLVLVWAYFGILSKHLSKEGFFGQYPNIIITVLLSMALLFIGAAIIYTTKKAQAKLLLKQ